MHMATARITNHVTWKADSDRVAAEQLSFELRGHSSKDLYCTVLYLKIKRVETKLLTLLSLIKQKLQIESIQLRTVRSKPRYCTECTSKVLLSPRTLR